MIEIKNCSICDECWNKKYNSEIRYYCIECGYCLCVDCYVELAYSSHSFECKRNGCEEQVQLL